MNKAYDLIQDWIGCTEPGRCLYLYSPDAKADIGVIFHEDVKELFKAVERGGINEQSA